VRLFRRGFDVNPDHSLEFSRTEGCFSEFWRRLKALHFDIQVVDQFPRSLAGFQYRNWTVKIQNQLHPHPLLRGHDELHFLAVCEGWLSHRHEFTPFAVSWPKAMFGEGTRVIPSHPTLIGDGTM